MAEVGSLMLDRQMDSCPKSASMQTDFLDMCLRLLSERRIPSTSEHCSLLAMMITIEERCLVSALRAKAQRRTLKTSEETKQVILRFAKGMLSQIYTIVAHRTTQSN